MASPVNKMVALAIVICLIASQISALSIQQLENMTKMPRNMCIQKTGVSKDLVDKFHKGDFVEDPKLKCYMKCAMGMMQVMKKDTYSADSAISQADKLLPDTHKERVKTAIGKCKDKGAGMTDGCEIAFAIIKCNYEVDPEVFLFP